MVTLCAHGDERYLPGPLDLQWLGPEGIARSKYQMAFNKSGRNRIRINLADAEFFRLIPAVARYSDLELFKTGKHGHHVAYPKSRHERRQEGCCGLTVR